MTLGTQTSLVERLTRSAGANTISTTSDATKLYINEGVREFCKRVHGLAIDTFVDLTPRIHVASDFAMKFTLKGSTIDVSATHVLLGTANAADTTPTNLMSIMVSNINALGTGSFTVSMGWSASTWSYYLYAPATATSVVIDHSDFIGYTDAVDIVFGGDASASGPTVSFGMPEDLLVDASLPTGFLEMKNVYYGTSELYEAPFSNFLRPRATGTPQSYAVKNKQIYLSPTPVKQDYFKIYYAGVPTDLGVDGSSDSVSCPLPEETHMAPVHWAAAKLFEEAHEFDKSIYHQRVFNDQVNGYIMREANNNPTMLPRSPGIVPPTVIE